MFDRGDNRGMESRQLQAAKQMLLSAMLDLGTPIQATIRNAQMSLTIPHSFPFTPSINYSDSNKL